jgi:hypothetical protein
MLLGMDDAPVFRAWAGLNRRNCLSLRCRPLNFLCFRPALGAQRSDARERACARGLLRFWHVFLERFSRNSNGIRRYLDYVWRIFHNTFFPQMRFVPEFFPTPTSETLFRPRPLNIRASRRVGSTCSTTGQFFREALYQ